MRRLTQQDIDRIIGTVISGYRILMARIKQEGFTDSDHYGILLGRGESGGMYVTWQFHLDDEHPDVYWGRYTENEINAIRDFIERSTP